MGETFKRLVLNVDTEVAKDRGNHSVEHDYPCVIVMDRVGSHVNDDELKRVVDAKVK